MKLTIVQPYLPHYRVPFFEGLISRLADHRIDCAVVGGEPEGLQAQRGDAASADWYTPIPTPGFNLGPYRIGLGGARTHFQDSDGVIVGGLGSSLDTWAAVLDRQLGRRRLGIWGHIRSYVTPGHPVDQALERIQLRRADHVFAYVPSGVEHAVAAGVNPDEVTAVMNTVPTDELVRERDAVTPADGEELLARFERRPEGPVVAYCGGLDASKRIDFLAEALDQLWEMDDSIRVLVAGRGRDAALLQPACDRGQAVLLGYADRRLLATVASVSQAFINPGRVGLVAVDALVLRRPLITTQWAFHAPEIEYLQENTSLFTSADSPAAFARTIVEVAVGNSHSPATQDWWFPTMSAMVDNFADGVLRMMGVHTPEVVGAARAGMHA